MSRYSRQVPLYGEEGQAKITFARVGIAGCGGLGVNVITQLASAGVSRFVIADPDFPTESNLNRQFVYAGGTEGSKVEQSADWIRRINPAAEVECRTVAVDEGNAAMFRGCDVVVDCLDNMPSRMALNRFCQSASLPLVHGGVSGFSGQVAVCIPGETPCLECMLSTFRGQEGDVPSVGAAVSLIGSMQAVEVLNVITGRGSPARGALVLVDMSDWTVETVPMERVDGCRGCHNRGSTIL